jgi:hypothetical protein
VTPLYLGPMLRESIGVMEDSAIGG